MQCKECFFKVVKGGAEDNINIHRKAFNFPNGSNDDGLLLSVFSGKKSKSIDFKIKVKATAIAGDYKYTLSLRDTAGNEIIKTGYFMIVHY